MGLADELSEDDGTAGCSVRLAMVKLSPEDAAAFAAAIKDDAIPIARIVRVMRRHDVRLSESALRRHRKGSCHCGIGT